MVIGREKEVDSVEDRGRRERNKDGREEKEGEEGHREKTERRR